MRYLRQLDIYLEYAFEAIGKKFQSQSDFKEYFYKINSDFEKEKFLKVCSFYLFLVKNCNLCIKENNTMGTISYINDAYKFVTIFSLIESIRTTKYTDFYSYLANKKNRLIFPIQDSIHLDTLYREYNQTHGSTNKCIDFFNTLSVKTKTELLSKIEIKDEKGKLADKEYTITWLAKELYKMRSKYVHELEFPPLTSNKGLVRRIKTGTLTSKLSTYDMMDYFEEGLIAYFMDC